MPGGTEDHLRALRQSNRGVGGEVVLAEVRFGLYDDAGRPAFHQNLADQFSGDYSRGALVKTAGKNTAGSHAHAFLRANSIPLQCTSTEQIL